MRFALNHVIVGLLSGFALGYVFGRSHNPPIGFIGCVGDHAEIRNMDFTAMPKDSVVQFPDCSNTN